jgi:hypothetical protein
MNNRQTAGGHSKRDGHQFEDMLAQHLGGDFAADDHGNQKTDVSGRNNTVRISVKNSDKAHTQVALIGQSSLIQELNLCAPEADFVKQFFGFSDGSQLNRGKLAGLKVNYKTLSLVDEISRNRILFHNIHPTYSTPFMSKLNAETRNKKILKYLIQGRANTLAWVQEKHQPSSVRYANMGDVIDFLATGVWRPSEKNSTLELMVGGKRYLYVQMKGSSSRFSSGYHSCMFHLYSSIIDAVPNRTRP